MKRELSEKELKKTSGGYELNLEECVGPSGCISCKYDCPVDAITIVDGYPQIDEGKCLECGVCIDACPHHCIKKI